MIRDLTFIAIAIAGFCTDIHTWIVRYPGTLVARVHLLAGVHELDGGHTGLDLCKRGVGAAHEADATDTALPCLTAIQSKAAP